MQLQYHLILYKYSHHQVNCVFRAACEYSFVSLLNNVNYLNSISCQFTLTVPSIHSPCIVKALQFLLKAHETITHKVSFLECSSSFLYRFPPCRTTNYGFVSPSPDPIRVLLQTFPSAAEDDDILGEFFSLHLSMVSFGLCAQRGKEQFRL